MWSLDSVLSPDNYMMFYHSSISSNFIHFDPPLYIYPFTSMFISFPSDCYPFSSISITFINFQLPLSIVIHFIHCHPFSSNLIHFHPMLPIFIQFYPQSSIFIHFIHFYWFASTIINFHSFYRSGRFGLLAARSKIFQFRTFFVYLVAIRAKGSSSIIIASSL